jgi:hypothetical protein
MTHKGFGEFKNKYIKIPYLHLISMEFDIPKNGIAQLKGFHHDFMGIIEQSGLIIFTDKVVNKFGCYEAKIWFNGIKKDKSFFPAHWTYEQVIGKICEAYDNFIATGAQNFEITPKGIYRLWGYTSEKNHKI